MVKWLGHPSGCLRPFGALGLEGRLPCSTFTSLVCLSSLGDGGLGPPCPHALDPAQVRSRLEQQGLRRARPQACR